MDSFIKRVKDNKKDPIDVFARLIRKTVQEGGKSMDTDDLEEDVYDSESLMNGRIYRGNIYAFVYNAKTPSPYTYMGQTVYFTDNMPIVLVTSETNTTIRGINLNFCNFGLKTLIMSLVRQLDTDFYEGGLASKIAYNKQTPISQKVYKFFSGDGEQQLARHLTTLYRDVDYSGIIRNYAVSNIGAIRLIEPWQWVDIPYLNYEGSLKKDTLEAIWKISGINKINI